MWTPPLTPAQGQGGVHSAHSSVSGVPNLGITGRRESERSESDRDESSVSGSKKRDLHAVPEAEETRESKRRRIAPTPITSTQPEGDSAIMSTEENTPTGQTPGQ